MIFWIIFPVHYNLGNNVIVFDSMYIELDFTALFILSEHFFSFIYCFRTFLQFAKLFFAILESASRYATAFNGRCFVQ